MIYLYRRRKRNRAGNDSTVSADASKDTQPYLARKAELDAEEARRHELEAVDTRFEMDGMREVQEMPVKNSRYEMPVKDSRHEMDSKNLGMKSS